MDTLEFQATVIEAEYSEYDILVVFLGNPNADPGPRHREWFSRRLSSPSMRY